MQNEIKHKDANILAATGALTKVMTVNTPNARPSSCPGQYAQRRLFDNLKPPIVLYVTCISVTNYKSCRQAPLHVKVVGRVPYPNTLVVGRQSLIPPNDLSVDSPWYRRGCHSGIHINELQPLRSKQILPDNGELQVGGGPPAEPGVE